MNQLERQTEHHRKRDEALGFLSKVFQRILALLLLSAAFATIGYFVGQFAPFTGLAPLGEPFSPIRDQAAFSYAVVGGLIGAFLSLLVKPVGDRS